MKEVTEESKEVAKKDVQVVGKKQSDESEASFRERMKMLFWNKQAATAVVGATAAGWQFGSLPIVAHVGGWMGFGSTAKVIGYSVIMTGSGWLVLAGGVAFLVGFGGIISNATIRQVEQRVISMFTDFKEDIQKQISEFKDECKLGFAKVDEFKTYVEGKFGEFGATLANLSSMVPSVLAMSQKIQALPESGESDTRMREMEERMNARFAELMSLMPAEREETPIDDAAVIAYLKRLDPTKRAQMAMDNGLIS